MFLGDSWITNTWGGGPLNVHDLLSNLTLHFKHSGVVFVSENQYVDFLYEFWSTGDLHGQQFSGMSDVRANQRCHILAFTFY